MDAAAGLLAVACPNCQAKPGEPCTQPTNTSRKPVSWFHSARVDAAGFWQAPHKRDGEL